MTSRRQWRTAGVVGITLIYASVSLSTSAGFGLLAFGDIAQFSLLFLAFLLMSANAVSTRGQIRLFWGLMALGCLLWSADLALWTLYEVILRRAIPEPFIGDADPLCSRGAVHGGGGAASPPIGGKEALLQHFELSDDAGVVGFPLRLHRVSGRVCVSSTWRCTVPTTTCSIWWKIWHSWACSACWPGRRGGRGKGSTGTCLSLRDSTPSVRWR